MQKPKRRKKEGIVDLNQAKLEENENPRPSVAASQKVPSPKNKKTQDNKGDAKNMPTVKKENRTIKPIGNVRDFKEKRKPIFDRDENGRILISRRTMIYGAIGAGAVLAGAAGIKVVSDTVDKTINSIDTLSVSKNNIVSVDDFAEIPDPFLHVANEVSLPYGSLV